MINSLRMVCKSGLKLVFEVCLLPFLVLWALISRVHNRPVDVGIGPEPLVTHQMHKRALEKRGYSAETYVTHLYFITDDFDILPPSSLLRLIFPYLLLFRVLWRYRCLYLYFNGGIMGLHMSWLWRFEPWVYRLAGIKVVVTAYGSDVQDLSRSQNLLYKAAVSIDYPNFRHRRSRISRNIDMWTSYADCIIGGCDWVDYMHHWDILIPAHFCVDTDDWQPRQEAARDFTAPLRVLHAPNHRAIKGTQYFEQAVEALKAEGVPIELIVIEKVANDQIRAVMETVDIVADQLIIGWYGNFAVEAMAMGKPTLAYLRRDLIDLFETYAIVERDEIPIINTSALNVKATLRDLALHRELFAAHEARSRAYAIKYHSIDAIGAVFAQVNQHIGLQYREN